MPETTQQNQGNSIAEQGGHTQAIRSLLIAVVQSQDADLVTTKLNKEGIEVTYLASTGGFLRYGNVTLLIGIHEGQTDSALNILRMHCQSRVEYIAPPLEGLPISFSTPVTVGGAIVFSLKVDRYEEII